MISFLSSWVKNLALALIIVSILEMILPNNRIKKYVKMVMGLYILFSIIAPFIENSDKFNFNDTTVFSQYIEENSNINMKIDQTSMDDRLNEMYEEQLEKDITQKLQEKGYKIEKCKVKAYISEENSGIENINLKIGSKIIENDSEQQSSNTIESKIITEIQKIQKVQINISENNEEEEKSDKQENTNITKTDIKIIKNFLINEYGVSEQCLKIS